MLVRPFSAGYVNPPRGNVISASPKVEAVCAAKRPFVRDLFFITPILNEEKKQRLSLTVLGKGWVVRVLHSLPGSSPPSDPKEARICNQIPGSFGKVGRAHKESVGGLGSRRSRVRSKLE